MEKKYILRNFSLTLLVNAFFAFILTITIMQFDLILLVLALPVVYLILMAIQQEITTYQHALYIALLIVLVPLLQFLHQEEKAVIFALYYLFTITSFDAAIRLKKPIPFPDVIPFIFVFVCIFLSGVFLVRVEPKIIYGLLIAYYLARLTTLYLAVVKEIMYKKEDQ